MTIKETLIQAIEKIDDPEKLPEVIQAVANAHRAFGLGFKPDAQLPSNVPAKADQLPEYDEMYVKK